MANLEAINRLCPGLVSAKSTESSSPASQPQFPMFSQRKWPNQAPLQSGERVRAAWLLSSDGTFRGKRPL